MSDDIPLLKSKKALVDKMLNELDSIMVQNGDKKMSRYLRGTLRAFGLATVVAWDKQRTDIEEAQRESPKRDLN